MRLATLASALTLPFLGRIVGLSPEITPTEDHYVVSKNVFDPNVRADGWELRILGRSDGVERPPGRRPVVEKPAHPGALLAGQVG